MRSDNRKNVRLFAVLILSVLAVIVPAGTVSAKKQPKTYPEEGKVIAKGLHEYAVERYSHTYTVVTDARVYLLDCQEEPGLIESTGPDCGGDKKLQIGDIIHFRVDKGWAVIAVTGIDHPGGTRQDFEQKLRILKEELNTDPKAANAPAVQPQTTETKPPEPKQ
ncbi:MAG: hypothetical protein ABSE40_11390 [Candidatus Sulfotelmatobacter sp.]|jgi:hypothetical protein